MNKIKSTVIMKILLLTTGLAGLGGITAEYGAPGQEPFPGFYTVLSFLVFAFFIFYEIYLVCIHKPRIRYVLQHKIKYSILIFILIEVLLSFFQSSPMKITGRVFSIQGINRLYPIIVKTYIIIRLLAEGLKFNKNILRSRIHPSRVFVLSFLGTILIGAMTLKLPVCAAGQGISFIDALFTSTSAVCVTGLITLDTANAFSPFGKGVIMALFQIGGLGLMTFTTFFAIFLAGGVGIKEKVFLRDLLDENNIGAITKVLVLLIVITFGIELIGAGVLYISLSNAGLEQMERTSVALFHSISAFCNAGFSLFSSNLYDPTVRNNTLFTFTISVLIILGGIGFPTIISLFKLKNKLFSKEKNNTLLSLQTKIILRYSAFFIIFGALAFFVLEYNNSLVAGNLWSKLYHSYFQSVSTRTAGFNTLDMSGLKLPAIILFCFLMFIGASPGGTGGGIKTTTLAITLSAIKTFLKNNPVVIMGNRAISHEIIIKVFTKIILTFFFISGGIFLLCLSENINLEQLIFEAFSAFGTVGLSMGATSSLSSWGKGTIILLMFIGRVGPLAFLYSILKSGKELLYELPEENISII